MYVYCNGFLTLYYFGLLSGRTLFSFTHHCKHRINPRFKSEQHGCAIATGYKPKGSPWVQNTQRALYLTSSIPVWQSEGVVLAK